MNKALKKEKKRKIEPKRSYIYSYTVHDNDMLPAHLYSVCMNLSGRPIACAHRPVIVRKRNVKIQHCSCLMLMIRPLSYTQFPLLCTASLSRIHGFHSHPHMYTQLAEGRFGSAVGGLETLPDPSHGVLPGSLSHTRSVFITVEMARMRRGKGRVLKRRRLLQYEECMLLHERVP